jgi:hypothetical protein
MVQKRDVCTEKEQQDARVDIKLEFFFLFKN